jgi:hypothetical protein
MAQSPAGAPASTAAASSVLAAQAAPTPPAANGNSTSATAAAPEAAPEVAATQVSPPGFPVVKQPLGLIRLGWSQNGATGNGQKFEQYGTPPSGVYLDLLRYEPWSPQGDIGVISLQSPAETDYRDYTQLALNGGHTQLEALLTRNRFFDPGTSPVPQSDWQNQDLNLTQKIAHWFSISTRYSMDDQDFSADSPDPSLSLHQRTRYEDVALAGIAGGGFAVLTFSDWRYFDRTQLTDNTDVRRWQATYQHDLGRQVLSAQYNYLDVSTATQPTGDVQIASVADDIHLGSATTASVALRKDSINLPVVQNALTSSYVREQSSATGSLVDRWSDDWNGEFAIQRRAAQLMANDSTDLDTPQWQTMLARVNGQLGRGWRVLANGTMENLWHSPLLFTPDANYLLWNNRQNAQVRLNGTSDFVQGYVDWSYNHTANSSTNTDVHEETINAGGDWQAAPKLDIYSDYTTDQWNAIDDAVGLPNIGMFATDSRVFTLGANWVVSTRAYINTSYSGFWASNPDPLELQDEQTTGQFLTMQFEYRMPKGQDFGLTVAPWAYRDEIASPLDYNSAVVRVTVSTPF